MNNSSFQIDGKIVDVVQGRIFEGSLTVREGVITEVREGRAESPQFITPGFVDAHVHVESSMLPPGEFARLAAVHGTLAAVSDPHEIANVLGLQGVEFMLEEAEGVPFYFSFGAPSCVPATSFESAGAKLDEVEVETLLRRGCIGYLSEVMNVPGVLHGDSVLMAKMGAAKRHNKPLDGHAPGLTGEDLERYIAAGISTDHECSTLEEGREKIRLGMKVTIREGSAARNFAQLIPLLKEAPEMVMFCSDDLHPDSLVAGHINLLLRRAVAAGCSPLDALRAASLNPVRHYHLPLGLLQEGDAADFLALSDLTSFTVLESYFRGEKITSRGESMRVFRPCGVVNNFSARPVNSLQLRVPLAGESLRVIEVTDGELVTGCRMVKPRCEGGFVESDLQRDILKLAVINRYQPSPPSVGFVANFGLKRGALASTVAHDSHNIIAVGVEDEQLVRAINLVIAERGGIAVVDGEKELVLPLPVAGLISNLDGYQVAQRYQQLDKAAKHLGSKLHAPFMTLSFLALLVIPELKLSDRGLFDGKRFEFVSLFG